MLSFEGKIVVSDFTKEGLRLIDKVHRSEGRNHDFYDNGLVEIEKHLRSADFRIEKQSDRFQEVLIAYHQLI